VHHHTAFALPRLRYLQGESVGTGLLVAHPHQAALGLANQPTKNELREDVVPDIWLQIVADRLTLSLWGREAGGAAAESGMELVGGKG